MAKPFAIIQNRNRFFYFDWRAFFEYRDLLYLMVRKEILSKYRQTLFGPLWYLLQPLLTSFVFFLIFTKALGVSTNGIPPVLFYLSGLLLWNFLSQTLTATSMALVSNAGLFKRVYFPRVMVPLAQTLAFLFTFGFQTLCFLSLYLYFKWGTDWGNSFHLTNYFWLLPFVLLQISLLAFGLGLWVSSMTVTYRDFHHLLSFVLMLWMYISPISYPIERIPQAYAFVVALNPLTPAIQILRLAFFGQGSWLPSHLLFSVGFTLVIAVSGFIYFQHVERNLIDKL